MSNISEYTSSEFFHFCGRGTLGDDEKTYEILKKILNDGCISHPPHNNDWGDYGYSRVLDGNLLDENLIVPTVTCYCDIPLQHLGIHIIKYGSFAVSFPRDFVIKHGARPVLYVPLRIDDWRSPFGQSMVEDIEAKYKGFMEHVVVPLGLDAHPNTTVGGTPSSPGEASALISRVLERDMLAFLKPFSSQLPDDHPENYYLEREWRKYGNLKFEASDVARVLLSNGFLDRFKRECPAYAGKAELI